MEEWRRQRTLVEMGWPVRAGTGPRGPAPSEDSSPFFALNAGVWHGTAAVFPTDLSQLCVTGAPLPVEKRPAQN